MREESVRVTLEHNEIFRSILNKEDLRATLAVGIYIYIYIGAATVLILYVKRNNILTLTPVNNNYMQISCIHMPMRIFQVLASGF